MSNWTWDPHSVAAHLGADWPTSYTGEGMQGEGVRKPAGWQALGTKYYICPYGQFHSHA